MDWLVAHLRPVVDSFVYSIVGSIILLGSFWIIQIKSRTSTEPSTVPAPPVSFAHTMKTAAMTWS